TWALSPPTGAWSPSGGRPSPDGGWEPGTPAGKGAPAETRGPGCVNCRVLTTEVLTARVLTAGVFPAAVWLEARALTRAGTLAPGVCMAAGPVEGSFGMVLLVLVFPLTAAGPVEAELLGVIMIDHELRVPLSNPQSSTQSCQVPLAFFPLNTVSGISG